MIGAASTLDNIERLYGFRKLTDYPIYAMVGLSLDDALSGWKRERNAAAVGALLVMCAGAFITIAMLQSKRAEDELAHASYRNQLLLRTASDAIHVLDAGGNVLEVSDAFCTMLGYSRALPGRCGACHSVPLSDSKMAFPQPDITFCLFAPSPRP